MNHIDIEIKDIDVMIGMPTSRDINPLTVKSLIRSVTHCREMGVPCDVGMVVGSAVIQHARDRVIELFLESSANRLFWVDSDMVWEQESFTRMLALSMLYPVICAAYVAKLDPPQFFLHFDKLVRNEAGLIEVNGAGLGFVVMHREVIEKLVEKSPKYNDQVSGVNLASVFRIDTTNGNMRTEDMAFFQDVKDLGYKVFLDPSIQLGHVGTKVYTGNLMNVVETQEHKPALS